MKKKIIFLVIIILILSGGFFYWWWWEKRETPPEKWGTAKNSPREDYVVKETPEGRVVENTEVGLSFEIPEEWIIKETPSFLPDFTFHSPDAKVSEERSDLLQKGCKINIAVAYIKTNLDVIEQNLKGQKIFNQPSIVNQYQRIKINNWAAIKHIFEVENLKMYYSVIHAPINNKLYEIGLAAVFQDKEQCIQEFNKFLETISIE